MTHNNDTTDADIIQFPIQGTTIAKFYAVVKGMKVDRKGQLEIALVVSADHKYQALPTTDFPGMLMEVTVERAILNYSGAIEAEARRLGMEVDDRDVRDADALIPDPFVADGIEADEYDGYLDV